MRQWRAYAYKLRSAVFPILYYSPDKEHFYIEEETAVFCFSLMSTHTLLEMICFFLSIFDCWEWHSNIFVPVKNCMAFNIEIYAIAESIEESMIHNDHH